MIEQKVPALQAGFVTSFETSALFDWKSRLGRMHSAEIWSFSNSLNHSSVAIPFWDDGRQTFDYRTVKHVWVVHRPQ